jgi:hypothetical protein
MTPNTPKAEPGTEQESRGTAETEFEAISAPPVPQKSEEVIPDEGPKGYLGWQARSNANIRKIMSMNIVESECLIDRINWLKHQAKNPENNLQLRAAVFGHYDWEENPTIDEEGFVNHTANSFARQWEQDLKLALGSQYKGFYDPDLSNKIKNTKVTNLKQRVTFNRTSTESPEKHFET